MSFSERLCTAGTFQGAGPSWQTPVKLETTQCHTGRVPSSNCTLALRAGSSCCNNDNDWLQSMFSFKPWTVRPNLQVDSNHLRAVLLCPRKIIVLSKHPHLRCDTSSIRNVFSLTYSQPLSVDDMLAASNTTYSNKVLFRSLLVNPENKKNVTSNVLIHVLSTKWSPFTKLFA